ncbi:hypothetical protein C2G38_2111875 [Gigaspora rosea]|uniref:Uncharacterized protein n=1 Tax=Gigaspora rosea TaxID=44941 RepID=A0A397UCX9_9GLOM|nr:hypothetical protein C2G38_2111875 [Gigaspora rosea]
MAFNVGSLTFFFQQIGSFCYLARFTLFLCPYFFFFRKKKLVFFFSALYSCVPFLQFVHIRHDVLIKKIIC